jgi:hypothetical protein
MTGKGVESRIGRNKQNEQEEILNAVADRNTGAKMSGR